MMSTVANLLDSATANYPLKEGLRVIDQDIRWNYSDLKVKHETAGVSVLTCKLGLKSRSIPVFIFHRNNPKHWPAGSWSLA